MIKTFTNRFAEIEKHLPTEDGQPPLGNATVWLDSVQCKVVSS
jgi:leucyl-tRNA synthetase